MDVTLAGAVAGWEHPAGEDFAARVAAGCARESARLRGHPFVLALALSQFGEDGLTETIELLQPVPALEEGAVRAEAECRVRAERLREERGWHELSVGGARALAPFRDAPFLAVRKIGDGKGIESAYLRVAVVPLAPGQPLDLRFVRVIGLDGELASWFARVAERPS